MAGEIVATAIAEEAVRSCFNMVGRYISYTRKYKKNIKILQVELKKIEDTRGTVQRNVQRAENNAEDIRQDVLGWLLRCEELKSNVNELLQTSRPFSMSCSCCSCPNLKSRYLTSSQAAELTSLITRHLEEGKFERVGQQPQLGQLPLLSHGEYHGLGSRTVIIKEVIDGLKDDSITVIGLCGMGGVGKTTLAKKIAEEVKNEKLFEEVAFVVVSQDANVKVIQDHIASRLGLKDIENKMDIQGRAELLFKRLMDEKKKILVILDDIWQELNLRSVGIPVHGDRRGFKILMTTRYDSVCGDMKVQKRVQVGILSKDEAWNLFKMTAEISVDTILETAEEVSCECAGLPLAIVMVGKSLRNKKEYAFRDVLRRLRNNSKGRTSRIDGVLYSCIRSSYDYLETEEHKSVLLLCSLFPEDSEIQLEDLVRYARGRFDPLESMAEARDRVDVVVDELMKCYLILPGEKRKCVKLHDIVRDVCLAITSESSDVYISSKIDEPIRMPDLKSQRLQFLRLVNNKDYWKSGLNSHMLRLDETKSKEMKFFEEMKELRVLEINHITINLPSYLPFMTNLQTLSLDNCRLQGDFVGIGSLKMLRVLSFFRSIVELFPMEIAQLTNLQCLDLRFHLKSPTTIPLGVLSSLKELEELYLGYNVSGDIEGLKAIRSFPKLHTIQFTVDKDANFLEVLLKHLNLSQLIKFDIAQVSVRFGEINYQIRENVLDFRGNNAHVDLYHLKVLMWKVKRFYLNREGLANVVDVFRMGSASQNLERLHLRNCDMKYFVDANYLAKGVFTKLDTLEIKHTSQLEELIHGDSRLQRLRNHFQCPLSNLRKIYISNCDNIRSLFSKSTMNFLRNLYKISVQSCKRFERFVTSQIDEEEDCSEVHQFPALRHLVMYELPRFFSFGPQSNLMAYFNQDMLPELETLIITFGDQIRQRGEVEQNEVCFLLGCSLPKVRNLKIRKCDDLLTVAKFGLVHGFQDLEKLEVSNCLSLEAIFDFEEITGHIIVERGEPTLLGRLEWLDLNCLPKMKHLWRMLTIVTPVFGNLKVLRVTKCGRLRSLLTPSLTNTLVHLEEIKLDNNKLMESVIGRGEMDLPNDGEEFLFGRIVLPKLNRLMIRNLPRFREICCCSPPSLSKLDITFTIEDILTRDQISCLTSLSMGRINVWEYQLTPSSAEQLIPI